MRKPILTLLIIIASMQLTAQSEEDAVRHTLQLYLHGTSYNNPEEIRGAFYDNASLFLSKKDQEIFIMTPSEYADLFEKGEQPKFNGRKGKIIFVSTENDIAIAKAEILIPDGNLRFMDIFLLKKIGGIWKIISKAATLMPSE